MIGALSVPVDESLKQAGFEDARMHVVRVIGEPRWMLSPAYNLGFRMAQYNEIIKVDADIQLRRNFFEKKLPQQLAIHCRQLGGC